MANNLQLYPKAYFNWVRLKKENNPSLNIEPWQVEDYRELSLETLFQRLADFGISLSEENFLIEAEAYPTPEELTQTLGPKKESEMPVYLILFELWRRLLPEKISLSIFCDELDTRIGAYLKDPTQNHGISNSILRLEELLEEEVDTGENPRAIFTTISRHLGHDLEGFFFDYISDQIENKNDLEAAELLNTFYPFFADHAPFDFLKAQLLLITEPHDGNLSLQKLLEQLTGNPDLDLLLEITAFLVHHGDPHLFQNGARLCLDHLQTEEDFQELLAMVADYCHAVEKESVEKQIQNIFTQRIKNPGTASIKANNPDVILLRDILDDPEWVKI